MRLLNATTLRLKQFARDIPPYAILSHTWGDEEVTFQEITASPDDAKQKNGFAKMLGCCRQARADMLDWVWIDTCCIDKTSSAELSEAINSMYAWYRDSEICYAFLEDVPAAASRDFPLTDSTEFRHARWFTRGWCLQELIAPRTVEFLANDWSDIGTKLSLCELIEEITAIRTEVLIDRDLERCCIAEKMSWASKRITTRVEDVAYCLLGIFDVNMPMLYGEGEKAFYRLQEEIIKHSKDDYTYLLWTYLPYQRRGPWAGIRTSPVMAPHPECFNRHGLHVSSGGYLAYKHLSRFRVSHSSCLPEALREYPWPWQPPQMTSRGLWAWVATKLLAVAASEVTRRLLWSGCHDCNRHGGYVCIELVLDPGTEGYMRSHDRLQVHLLHARELEGIEVSEMYLSSTIAIPWKWRSIAYITPPFPLEMDVFLSSSSADLAVCLIESTPIFNFWDMTDQDPRAAAEGTQLWRARHGDMFTASSERHLVPVLTIWLEIRSRNGLQSCELSRERIGVVLDTHSGRWICGINKNVTTARPTDRAEYELLHGGVLVANLKTVTRETGRLRAILRVRVRPGSLRVGLPVARAKEVARL